MSESPQIVTFYSYKGGVGRSMAVLNVAYAMAGRGLNVLVLDLDLEAPGLSGFLHRNKELGSHAPYDMVDLLRWACEVARAPSPVEQAALPPASDYIVSIPIEKFSTVELEFGGLGRLDFVPVDEGRDYYSRMTALGIGNLDRDSLIRIGSVLRSWLKSRKFTSNVPDYYGIAAPAHHYDFILVDSRTGVTEIGGLCIGPLSDNLVVLTALNDQNINGTKQFLEEVGVLAAAGTTGRLDPKPTLIVASPVPAGEIKTKEERLEKLRQAVGKIVVKLSYHPQLALFETIFVRDHQDEYLTKEYLQLVELISKFGSEAESIVDVAKIFKSTKDEQREHFRRLLHNLSRSKQNVSFLDFITSSKEFTYDKEDLDYLLLDRSYRYCSQSDGQNAIDWDLARGALVLEWAGNTTNVELKNKRFVAAERVLSHIAASPFSSNDQKIKAIGTLGNLFSGHAKQKTGEEADRLFAQAGEKYEAALRIKPDMHEAFLNWGAALAGHAKQKTGQEADRLFAQAGEKYEAALRIKPDKHEALNNWGAALLAHAKQKTGEEADRLFAQAREKLLNTESLIPGKGAYNLACLSALQGHIDECKKWLLRSLEFGSLPSKQHLLEDLDLESVLDLDWFQELLAKLG